MILAKGVSYYQQEALRKAREGHTHLPIAVTATRLGDGTYKVLSYLADDVWRFPNAIFPPGTADHDKCIRFGKIPERWRSVLKIVMLEYYLNGIEGRVRPVGSSLISFFKNVSLFLKFAGAYVECLSEISEFLCMQYVNYLKNSSSRSGDKFSKSYLCTRLSSVHTLHLLSKVTTTPMVHPWPESSATELSGANRAHWAQSKTLPIPDNKLAEIFRAAVSRLERADETLALAEMVSEWQAQYSYSGTVNAKLAATGYRGGILGLRLEKNLLLDACSIVILLTSGIRVSEFMSLKVGAHYVRDGEDGTKFYWMSGVSTKTKEGKVDWLVTKLTHEALDVAGKVTAEIRAELNDRYSLAKSASNLIEMHDYEAHLDSLFLGWGGHAHKLQVFAAQTIRARLKRFMLAHNIDWEVAPHQFRRTFARYVARSQLGDVRYLRDHFKHWTLDMTAIYAEDQVRDKELFDEIYVAMRHEKMLVLESVFEEDALVSGGLAETIRIFRSSDEAIRTYKSRREMVQFVSEVVHLRSTGIAWCTADSTGCSGGSVLDKTRCGDCSKSLIDESRLPHWVGIYAQMLELKAIANDCGPGAGARIDSDIRRCEVVLQELGADIEELKLGVLLEGGLRHA